jgi:hypothetical protein
MPLFGGTSFWNGASAQRRELAAARNLGDRQDLQAPRGPYLFFAIVVRASVRAD